MPPEAHQLLAMAVEKLELGEVQKPGKGPAGPLSKELGISYQRVYRWFQPGNEPDYEGTMLLLEKCGWLNIDADAPALAEPTADPLVELQGAVDATLALAEKIDGRLEAVEQRLQRAAPQRATSTRGKTRKASGS